MESDRAPDGPESSPGNEDGQSPAAPAGGPAKGEGSSAPAPAPDKVDEPQASLTRQTLLKMAIRIAAVLMVTVAIGYYHIFTGMTGETLSQLSKYVVARGQRERGIFTLAVDNHAALKSEILRRFAESGAIDPKEEFERYTARSSDGVIRNAPGFDGTRDVGIYIDKSVPIDAEIRRRVILFRDIVRAYGPAWHPRFQDTYVTTPENIMVIYWPELPTWCQDAKADLRMPDEEYVWVADEKHNPKRATVWTGLFYDKVGALWMLSCETPIDVGGKQVGTLGNDIILNELLDRTIKDRLPGTYNMIFRGDGRLLVHPEKIKEIQDKEGKYLIPESSDEHLKRVFKLATSKSDEQAIVDNDADGEYLAVTRIDELDSYFVTVFPKSLIRKNAFEVAQIYLILGFLALLIEIVIMYFVLRSQIAAPLAALMGATKRVRGGDMGIHLDAERKDELGHLARSFNLMAEEIDSREQHMKAAKEEALRLSGSLADANEELARSLSKAEEIARLKSEFLANTSHELRTPLNAILNIPEGILREFKESDGARCAKCETEFEFSPGEVFDAKAPCPECGERGSLSEHKVVVFTGDASRTAEYMRALMQSGTHLLTVVNDVLDFSKLDAGQMVLQLDTVSIAQVFHDVGATLRPLAAQRHIELKMSEVGPDAVIMADSVKLSQILINLVANALKFSEPNGAVEVGCAKEGPDYVFHVRDYGIGIAPEHQSIIFESFRQVDGSHTRKHGGTGLGLAITKKLVELHGGTIRIESKVGEGSTFYVKLPANGPPAPAEVPKDSVKEEAPGERRTILVVDDDPVIIESMRLSLRNGPFNVIGTTDPRRVDALISLYKPDLVILDIMMPRVSGMTILRALHDKPDASRLPVLVCSGYHANEEIASSFGAGWLGKPWNNADLMRAVSELVAKGKTVTVRVKGDSDEKS